MHILTITLPIPPRTLNLNAHITNWRIRYQAEKAYKEAAYFATLNAINRNPEFRQRLPFCRARLIPAMFFPTARRRDDDNWAPALKAARDGIARAGVVVNDETITTSPPALNVDKSKPRVEIMIEAIVSEAYEFNDEKDDA